MLLYCILKKETKLLIRYKKLFPTEDGSAIGKYQYDDLVTRGYLKKIGEDGTSKDFEVGENFSKLFVDKYFAAEEFKAAYPPFLISNGMRMPLTGMDEDELVEVYSKKILGSSDEHKEVMLDLEYGASNNLIMMAMEKFVKSRGWLSIRVDRLKHKEAVNNGAIGRTVL